MSRCRATLRWNRNIAVSNYMKNWRPLKSRRWILNCASERMFKKERKRKRMESRVIIIHFNYTGGESTIAALVLPARGQEARNYAGTSSEWTKFDRINHENCICESLFVCPSIKIHAAAPMRNYAEQKRLDPTARRTRSRTARSWSIFHALSHAARKGASPRRG